MKAGEVGRETCIDFEGSALGCVRKIPSTSVISSQITFFCSRIWHSETRSLRMMSRPRKSDEKTAWRLAAQQLSCMTAAEDLLGVSFWKCNLYFTHHMYIAH